MSFPLTFQCKQLIHINLFDIAIIQSHVQQNQQHVELTRTTLYQEITETQYNNNNNNNKIDTVNTNNNSNDGQS